MIKEIFTWRLTCFSARSANVYIILAMGVIYVVCGCGKVLSPRLRSLEVLRPLLYNLYLWLL